MAKKKNTSTDVVEATNINWAEIADISGCDILDKLDTVTCWIDTGVLALNYVCSGRFVGGGVPCGKVVEIYGDSATGKSLIGANIMKGAQTIDGIPILLDAEHAVSKDFAVKASKVDPARFYVTSADTLEGCFSKIYTTIKKLRSKIPLKHPIVIVYDSIAASPSEREFAETVVDMANASQAEIKSAGAGSDMPGERAKTCSKHFRNLPNILEQNNTCLVVINQIRKKIGVMWGDDTATAGGGRALEYYASLRLKLRANKVPKDKNGDVMGVNISVTNVKNRCFKPYVEAKNMYLFFEQGINPFSGLLDLFEKTGRIISTSAGNFTVCEPYCEGKEVKFKSSKERNDVPSSVLLACPKLVDADSAEQVRYYVDLYQSAIDAVDHGIANEDNCEPE